MYNRFVIVCHFARSKVKWSHFEGTDTWQILRASFWKFTKLSNSGISLNWSITDEVTARHTTAYFFGPLCRSWIIPFLTRNCPSVPTARLAPGIRRSRMYVATTSSNRCICSAVDDRCDFPTSFSPLLRTADKRLHRYTQPYRSRNCSKLQ